MFEIHSPKNRLLDKLLLTFTRLVDGEENILDEGQHTVVCNVARLTESLLQLLLDHRGRVQQVDLAVLL